MNQIFKKSYWLILAGVVLGGCSKFEEINTNPTAANGDQVQVEYFINQAIMQDQQNPGVSERAFILYWTAAGRQVTDADGATFSWGDYNDEWIGEYYNNISSALNAANTAIQVGEQQLDAGKGKPYTNNLIQVARVYRAYLMSEMSDNFGPIPIDAFQGTNPEFSSVKDVYYYMLDELKDASAKIDLTVSGTDIKDEDPAYGFDFSKWQRYANSLRLRLAMRLSEVDPQKAKAEFEDADTKPLLTDVADIFQIQEKPGWDNLSGVYTRSWYLLPLSTTLNNLTVNLGGIKTKDMLPNIITSDTSAFNKATANIKPNDYLGRKFQDYFSTKTNNPVAGFWYDGLHTTIDPRMYQMFYIPGDINSPTYPSAGWVSTNTKGYLFSPTDPNKKVDSIDASFSWNPLQDGNYGTMYSINQLITISSANGFVPSLNNSFREQKAQRVFFAPWETYFLLAEAAVRGWSTPISAKDAYEKGVASSFEYWGVSQYLSAYLASTDYNTDGTSVNWDNTTEPPASRIMSYTDGKTGVAGTQQIKYPVNNLYKNGTLKNDHLTKIITQKFIAQTPWLPLETWSDHRRLGLPFFENVVVQDNISTLPGLQSDYMDCKVKYLPQRMKYPSGLVNSNAKGYSQATELLGSGGDEVLTPLWWAQQ